MSQKWVLDSFALLAYLKMEGKFSKIKSHLSSHDSIVLMNEISIGETYYILARERSLEKADYFITTILSNLPIRHMSNTFQDVIEAARIKATHSISFADCFTVATAIREKALVVTGDPEFKKVEHFVEIDWI